MRSFPAALKLRSADSYAGSQGTEGNGELVGFTEYFRSHPPATERKAALETEIRKMGWKESAPVRPLKVEP